MWSKSGLLAIAVQLNFVIFIGSEAGGGEGHRLLRERDRGCVQ